MRRTSPMSGLSDSLAQALKKYHLEKRLKQEIAAAGWADVVGEKCAAASRPETVRDGILFVSCKSSAWAQELTFLKDRIISEMNKRVGAAVIKDIRFAGTGLRKSREAVGGEEENVPSPKEIQDIKLGSAELLRVSRAVEDVKDPDLAAKMRGAMETRQKLEHWRLAHGWRKCPGCGDLFKGKGPKCPACS
ncbi:MAG: DUF721 domain-containing protein [Armatimonadota bacterium]|nr:DUF721 domain-containing protein [Armatimonadota bacterium]